MTTIMWTVAAVSRVEGDQWIGITDVTVYADTETEAREKAEKHCPGRELYYTRYCTVKEQQPLTEYEKMSLANYQTYLDLCRRSAEEGG